MRKPVSSYSNAQGLDADFSAIQSLEARSLAGHELALAALSEVSWFVELAPVTSPSPKLAIHAVRQRVLFDHQQLVWPFASDRAAWPLESQSLPLLLVRHAWQPGAPDWAFDEWVRVLKPGGWLITVSVNPWHPSAWRWLGRRAMYLPSWPHLLWLHQHKALRSEIRPLAVQGWQRLKLSPMLILVAQKRAPVAPIRPQASLGFKFNKPSAAVAAQCRAA